MHPEAAGGHWNQDGTINSPDHPAPRGSRVAIYGTGDGQTLPAGVDGIIVGQWQTFDTHFCRLPHRSGDKTRT